MATTNDTEAAVRARLIAERRASRVGRPQGSTVPLMQHPRRFETAAWAAATMFYGVRPTVAGALVAALFSTRPIQASVVQGVLLALSTDVPNASLKGRADTIQRRAEAALNGRTDADLAWLTACAGELVALLESGGDAGRMAVPLLELRSLGWGPTLDRIGHRLFEAFASSNLPPAPGPIPAKALRLAEAVRMAEAVGKAQY